MRATIQVVERIVSFGSVLAVLVAGVACHDKNGSTLRNTITGPTGTVTSPTGTVTSIAITGTAQLDRPGDTSQLTATATSSDGTTKDVTAEAHWFAEDPPGVVTVERGLVTAVAYGKTEVRAHYPMSPAPGRAVVRVLPAGTFVLTGTVTGGGFSVQGARVDAISPAGTVSTGTDDWGGYTLAPVAGGDVTVRAEKDGYSPQTKRLTLSGDGRQDLDLQPLGGSSTTAEGPYTLTITASSSCRLPPELMRRQYQAQLRADAKGGLLVLLAPETWECWGAGYGFTGTRDGNTVRFDISDNVDGVWAFHEVLTPVGAGEVEALRWRGTASGTVADRRIVAQLSGRIRALSGPGFTTVLAECEAADHVLEFVR